MDNTIGNNIRKLRIKRNFTQQELATKSKISLSALNKYERGDRTPKIDIIEKLAKALNVSVSTLTSEENFDAEIMQRATQLAIDKMLFNKMELDSESCMTLNSSVNNDIFMDLGYYADYDTILSFYNKITNWLPDSCVLGLLNYIHDMNPREFINLYKDLISTNIYNLSDEIKNHCDELYLQIVNNFEFRDLGDSTITGELIMKNNNIRKKLEGGLCPEKYLEELLKNERFPTYKLDNITLQILYEKTMNFLSNELFELEKTNYRYPADNENNNK